jgi:hypothetical protein
MIFVALVFPVLDLPLIQESLDLVPRIMGAQEGTALRRPVIAYVPDVVLMLIPDGEGGTERPAGIARRRLDPDVLEYLLFQDLAVGDAIQGHAARQAKVVGVDLLSGEADDLFHDLFQHDLDGRGQIHVDLAQFGLGLAARGVEKLGEFPAGHGQSGMKIEVLQVQAERAVFLDIHQFPENDIAKHGFPVRGQPHELVFPGIHLESGEIGERRIEEPQGMRKSDALKDFKVVAIGPRDGQCIPFAHPVHGDDGGVLEGGRIERGGDVRFMMADEEYREIVTAQPFPDDLFNEDLFLGPNGNRRKKTADADRGELHVRGKQPVQL